MPQVLSRLLEDWNRSRGDRLARDQARRAALQAELQARQALSLCVGCESPTRWKRVGVVAGQGVWLCKRCEGKRVF